MGNWRKGWTLAVHALNVFKVYPAFLAPIFLAWIVYASGILHLRYGFPGSCTAGGRTSAWCSWSFSFFIYMGCAWSLSLYLPSC